MAAGRLTGVVSAAVAERRLEAGGVLRDCNAIFSLSEREFNEAFSVADPVKAARPGGPTSGPRGPHVGHGGSGPGQQHPVPHAEQLRRLEAEVAARAAEVKAARAERDQAGRGVEALSVIIHHLTHTVSTCAAFFFSGAPAGLAGVPACPQSTL